MKRVLKYFHPIFYVAFLIIYFRFYGKSVYGNMITLFIASFCIFAEGLLYQKNMIEMPVGDKVDQKKYSKYHFVINTCTSVLLCVFSTLLLYIKISQVYITVFFLIILFGFPILDVIVKKQICELNYDE